MEQAAQNNQIGADHSNKIHNIESTMAEVQLWCVTNIVKNNAEVECLEKIWDDGYRGGVIAIK